MACAVACEFDSALLGAAVQRWVASDTAAQLLYGPIASWNVSGVQSMASLFASAGGFDAELGSWDSARHLTPPPSTPTTPDTPCLRPASRVTDLHGTFSAASAFNGNLSLWDTSSCTQLAWAFFNADAFVGEPGHWPWDTSLVQSMESMFSSADAFDGNLGAWDVASVRSVESTFDNAYAFNQARGDGTRPRRTALASPPARPCLLIPRPLVAQPLTLDTGSVTTMNSLFRSATSLNQPLSFDTSSVFDVDEMFYNAQRFNQPILLDAISVNTSAAMLRDAVALDQQLALEQSSHVVDMSNMLKNANSFNKPLDLDTAGVTDMSFMLDQASSFNQVRRRRPPPAAATRRVRPTACLMPPTLLAQAVNFDTASVTDMGSMFQEAESFNRPLNFDASRVTAMSFMIDDATMFNQATEPRPARPRTRSARSRARQSPTPADAKTARAADELRFGERHHHGLHVWRRRRAQPPPRL